MDDRSDSHLPVAPNSQLDLISRGVARELAAYCATHGCTQRDAIATLSRSTPLTRQTSGTIPTRLPTEQVHEIKRSARYIGVTPSEYVRTALSLLARGKSPSSDPRGMLAQLALDLGLPKEATAADVLDAVQKIAAAVAALDAVDGGVNGAANGAAPAQGGAPPDPSAEASDTPAPAKPFYRSGAPSERIPAPASPSRETLSPATLAKIAKAKITVDEYLARRREIDASMRRY